MAELLNDQANNFLVGVRLRTKEARAQTLEPRDQINPEKRWASTTNPQQQGRFVAGLLNDMQADNFLAAVRVRTKEVCSFTRIPNTLSSHLALQPHPSATGALCCRAAQRHARRQFPGGLVRAHQGGARPILKA